MGLRILSFILTLMISTTFVLAKNQALEAEINLNQALSYKTTSQDREKVLRKIDKEIAKYERSERSEQQKLIKFQRKFVKKISKISHNAKRLLENENLSRRLFRRLSRVHPELTYAEFMKTLEKPASENFIQEEWDATRRLIETEGSVVNYLKKAKAEFESFDLQNLNKDGRTIAGEGDSVWEVMTSTVGSIVQTLLMIAGITLAFMFLSAWIAVPLLIIGIFYSFLLILLNSDT